jgi:hypothetical protein
LFNAPLIFAGYNKASKTNTGAAQSAAWNISVGRKDADENE